MATDTGPRTTCQLPACPSPGAALLNGVPLCRSHYCVALEALEALGLSPRVFRGNPLDLVLLEWVEEDLRLSGSRAA